MKTISVLVNGVGGILGQGIIKSLRTSKYSCFIVGMDANPLSYGLFAADKAYKIPFLHESDVLEKIIAICRKHSIDIIFPALEQDTLFFARHRKTIETSTGAIVVVNDEKNVRMFNDKWETYKWLCKHQIPTPPTILVSEGDEPVKSFIRQYKYPLILKPRDSHGGKNLFIINQLKELEFYVTLKKHEKFILQKCIGMNEDNEFTCGAFVEKTGQLVDVIVLKRKLSEEGFTKESMSDSFPEVRNVCVTIIKWLGWQGFLNIQIRMENNIPYVLEINPRISASNSMRTLFGFNEPEMAITSFLLRKSVDKPILKKGIAIRYVEDFAFSDIVVNKDGEVEIQKNGEY